MGALIIAVKMRTVHGLLIRLRKDESSRCGQRQTAKTVAKGGWQETHRIIDRFGTKKGGMVTKGVTGLSECIVILLHTHLILSPPFSPFPLNEGMRVVKREERVIGLIARW